jgi:hypothetical protein
VRGGGGAGVEVEEEFGEEEEVLAFLLVVVEGEVEGEGDGEVVLSMGVVEEGLSFALAISLVVTSDDVGSGGFVILFSESDFTSAFLSLSWVW